MDYAHDPLRPKTRYLATIATVPARLHHFAVAAILLLTAITIAVDLLHSGDIALAATTTVVDLPLHVTITTLVMLAIALHHLVPLGGLLLMNHTLPRAEDTAVNLIHIALLLLVATMILTPPTDMIVRGRDPHHLGLMVAMMSVHRQDTGKQLSYPAGIPCFPWQNCLS